MGKRLNQQRYSLHDAAGLSDLPPEFCTKFNDSEAINSALKQFLAFKKSECPIFNEKMQKGSSWISHWPWSIFLKGVPTPFSCTKPMVHCLGDDQTKDAQWKIQHQWIAKIFFHWMTDWIFCWWMMDQIIHP